MDKDTVCYIFGHGKAYEVHSPILKKMNQVTLPQDDGQTGILFVFLRFDQI